MSFESRGEDSVNPEWLQFCSIAHESYELDLRYFFSVWVNDECFERNAFIYLGCIELIKSDSKDIYNATKDFYFK